mmetsp:Transcript_39002/g.44444  ORF Transcript_39002/g.44444 Transcript_39002/m.44444 type:complete len:87 (+) Transcript_39002:304-564(+)
MLMEEAMQQTSNMKVLDRIENRNKLFFEVEGHRIVLKFDVGAIQAGMLISSFEICNFTIFLHQDNSTTDGGIHKIFISFTRSDKYW